jgi:hypothetical protein
MTEESLHYRRFRPDVSMWRRNEALYLVTSRGPLRLRGGLPEDVSENAKGK